MAIDHASFRQVDDNEERLCRVCRDGEDVGGESLTMPCKCDGSVGLVHASCLTKWLAYSNKDHCELCGYRFRFEPVLAPDAPSRLPTRELLFAAMIAAARRLPPLLSLCAVTVLWCIVVPVFLAYEYRLWAHYGTVVSGRLSLVYHRLAPPLLLLDWASGVAIGLSLVLGMLFLSILVDAIRMHWRRQTLAYRSAELTHLRSAMINAHQLATATTDDNRSRNFDQNSAERSGDGDGGTINHSNASSSPFAPMTSAWVLCVATTVVLWQQTPILFTTLLGNNLSQATVLLLGATPGPPPVLLRAITNVVLVIAVAAAHAAGLAAYAALPSVTRTGARIDVLRGCSFTNEGVVVEGLQAADGTAMTRRTAAVLRMTPIISAARFSAFCIIWRAFMLVMLILMLSCAMPHMSGLAVTVAVDPSLPARVLLGQRKDPIAPKLSRFFSSATRSLSAVHDGASRVDEVAGTDSLFYDAGLEPRAFDTLLLALKPRATPTANLSYGSSGSHGSKNSGLGVEDAAHSSTKEPNPQRTGAGNDAAYPHTWTTGPKSEAVVGDSSSSYLQDFPHDDAEEAAERIVISLSTHAVRMRSAVATANIFLRFRRHFPRAAMMWTHAASTVQALIARLGRGSVFAALADVSLASHATITHESITHDVILQREQAALRAERLATMVYTVTKLSTPTDESVHRSRVQSRYGRMHSWQCQQRSAL